MNLKRILSAITAVAMVIPCIGITTAGAISSSPTYEQEDEESEPVYVPDFPQEILDEFQISWTGLTFNTRVDNSDFSFEDKNNHFEHDGGYAFYGDQSLFNEISFWGNWHDCNSYTMYQSKAYPLPDNYDYNSPYLHVCADITIKEEGDARFGPVFELSGGKYELFVIEKYSASASFPEEEFIGTYSSDGKEYRLYKEADDAVEENAACRYYAVCSTGIIQETEAIGEYDDRIKHSYVMITDHLSELKKITGEDITLDRYGMLAEGSKGIGNVFCGVSCCSKNAVLPEEKLSYDENGQPVSYKRNMIKNLDGYRYSLQTINNSFPVTNLGNGQFSTTEHENNSYIIPRGNGTFSAESSEGIFSYISAGKEYDGTTPLLDSDYRLDYEYTSSSENVNLDAVVWTTEPYTKFIFAEEDSKNLNDNYSYLGNIKLGNDNYKLYKTYPRAYDTDPLGTYERNGYTFIHLKNDNEEQVSETRKISVPISALVRSAKYYGAEAGNLCRISLEAEPSSINYKLDVLKNEITTDNPSTEQEKNPEMYSIVGSSPVSVGRYTFEAYNADKMYAYENGLFTLEMQEKNWADCCSSVFSRQSPYIIDSSHDLNMEYKIKNGFDKDYAMMYLASGYSENSGHVSEFYIIEKNDGISVEECQISYAGGGMSRLPVDLSPKYVMTYTAGGHEYDVYKDSASYAGCFSSYYLDSYLCIRKDQSDDAVLEGSINLGEHLSQFSDLLGSGFKTTDSTLRIITKTAKGKVEVLKNDIEYGETGTEAVIIGDFNTDSSIDSLDVARAKKLLLETFADEKTEAPAYMDTNRNGTFELADVVLLQSFVLGKIKTFPPAVQ